MKKIKTLVMLFVLGLIAGTTFAESNNQLKITGIWLGKMQISDAVEMQIGYVISKKEDGKLKATMNVIEQKAFDIPMDSVYVIQDSVKISFTAAGIFYTGKLDSAKELITGHYNQGDLKVELNLRLVNELPGEVVREQTPERPFPYLEEEVVFFNNEDNVELSGTLSIPQNASSLPAIILVHGSGHTDRNETKMGHFLLLSDYFTRNGFVVLRYDKRGVGKSLGDYSAATTMDFSRDAEAGISYLKERKEVDSNGIGIIGHSEGTLIASMIASKSDDLAFIVLMGAMGTNGGDIRIQQTQKISQLNGVPEEEINENLEQISDYHSILITNASRESKFNKIQTKYPNLDEGLINYFLNPWYTSLIQLEPTQFLKKTSCPVLALTGENDVQCIPEKNLPHIEKALIEAKNPCFSIQTLPELNHLFQTSKSGLPIEYENIAEIIAPSALKTMLDWITSL